MKPEMTIEKTNPQCPIDGHSDQIIPIIYGMPSEKLWIKADKGKVKLGGCLVSDDNPKWYCKKHGVEF